MMYFGMPKSTCSWVFILNLAYKQYKIPSYGYIFIPENEN